MITKESLINDQKFKQWLLNVGDGIFSDDIEESHEVINILSEMLCDDNIIHVIFGTGQIDSSDEDINDKVILSTINVDVLELNQ